MVANAVIEVTKVVFVEDNKVREVFKVKRAVSYRKNTFLI